VDARSHLNLYNSSPLCRLPRREERMPRGTNRRLHCPTKFTPLDSRGYRVRSLIGQGGFGSVFLADHGPTREFRAVKATYKGDLRRSDLENEIELHRRAGEASTTNVVQLFEVVEDPSFVFMCLEACMGGHLLYRLSKHTQFTERHAACAVADVLGVLEALHEMEIAHRDLKPQNLMYAHSRPDAPLKLIDFGMAVDLHRVGGKVSQFAGTIRFMAPSVIREMPYGVECDLWALGVTTFLLLSGEYPFNGTTVDEVAADVLHGTLRLSGGAWDTVSDDAKDFIQRLLRDDALDVFVRARARARAPRLRTATQALAHPWIVNRGPRSAGLLDDRVRARLHAAHRRNLLDTAISNLAAARLRADDLRVLLDQFDLLDVNGDGYVTLDEYLQGVASLEVTLPELRAQFAKFDLNCDQRLSRAEFAAACMDRNKLSDADLPSTFDFLAVDDAAAAPAEESASGDAPQSGQGPGSASSSHRPGARGARPREGAFKHITPQSLAESLLRMGSSETAEGLSMAATAAIAEADKDNDGALSYDEYCAWVRRARELEPLTEPKSRTDPGRVASKLKRGKAWAAEGGFYTASGGTDSAAGVGTATASRTMTMHRARITLLVGVLGAVGAVVLAHAGYIPALLSSWT